MNKNNIIIISAVLLALLLIAGCSQGTTQRNQVATPSPLLVATQPEAAPQQKAPSSDAKVAPTTSAANVELQSFAFSPSSLTVKKGVTVTWTQKDSVPHTIVSDNGAFESPQLSKGQTWNFTFNDAGTYSYHCSIHPSMTAKIVVE